MNRLVSILPVAYRSNGFVPLRTMSLAALNSSEEELAIGCRPNIMDVKNDIIDDTPSPSPERSSRHRRVHPPILVDLPVTRGEGGQTSFSASTGSSLEFSDVDDSNGRIVKNAEKPPLPGKFSPSKMLPLGETIAIAQHGRSRSWTSLLFKGLSRSKSASQTDLKNIDDALSIPISPAIPLEAPQQAVSWPTLPGGAIGLKNVGNTCFINAAIQCLRWCPALALSLIPDLLEKAKGTGAMPITPEVGALDVHEAALARASASEAMEVTLEPQESSDPVEEPSEDSKPKERPKKGDLADAFRYLVTELFVSPASTVVDPAKFFEIFRRFPDADDLLNGGQHDCQELLVTLLHLLHEDLKIEDDVCAMDVDEEPSNEEARKAERHWQTYLSKESSLITKLFAGQLQSSVVCSKCQGRFTMYEPFFSLSLPLVREPAKNAWLKPSFLNGSSTTIQDCLSAFASEEKMEGGEAFDCEKCAEKTSASKHLRVFRLPPVLLLSLNRFKQKNNGATDKLTGTVTFPLEGLSLQPYQSLESPHTTEECTYDVVAVANHYGGLAGGHYQAFCRTTQAALDISEFTEISSNDEDNYIAPPAIWTSYDDDIVNKIMNPAKQVVSEHAYMLVLARRHPQKYTLTPARPSSSKGNVWHSRKRSNGGDTQ